MQGHVIIKKFVEYSRAMAPAKYQKSFKSDIQNWLRSLDDGQRLKLAQKLTAGHANKYKLWTPISNEMLNMFYKKSEVSGG